MNIKHTLACVLAAGIAVFPSTVFAQTAVYQCTVVDKDGKDLLAEVVPGIWSGMTFAVESGSEAEAKAKVLAQAKQTNAAAANARCQAFSTAELESKFGVKSAAGASVLNNP